MRPKESTESLDTHALNLKPNQNRVHQRQTKQQQQRELENKAVEIRAQTMTQTIYTYHCTLRKSYIRPAPINDQTRVLCKSRRRRPLGHHYNKQYSLF